MLNKEIHYGHEGYCVFETYRSKKRYFVFRDELGFGEGVKKESIVIQVLRPKVLAKKVDGKWEREHDMEIWHFAKRYNAKGGKAGLLERIIWPPVLSREIAQAIINVAGDNIKETVKDTSKDLEEYGI